MSKRKTATASSCSSSLPEWQTRPRRITATITVDVHTYNPKDMLKAAEYRKRDLEEWLARHQKDIQNEMAHCDDINIEVVMGYQDE